MSRPSPVGGCCLRLLAAVSSVWLAASAQLHPVAHWLHTTSWLAGCHPSVHAAHTLLAGFRTAVLSSGLGSRSVSPFASCTNTAGATIAIETDASCLVRIYVLGDTACSVADKLTIVDG